MIVICLASRGLVFTQTMQSIFNGMAECSKLGLATKLVTSHNLPIPDSQNYVAETALQMGATRLLFIEEDMVLFEKEFVKLATSEVDIGTMQYNDKNGSPHGIIHYNELGEVLWGGLGATIIQKRVFDKMDKPYFNIDDRYRVTRKFIDDTSKLVTRYEKIEPRKVWDEKELKFIEKKDNYKYGGQDINFYTKARELGFKAEVVEGKAHHLALVKLGTPHVNNGCHVIRQV